MNASTIAPGIYPDLPNALYHGHSCSYSKSSLVDFLKYPFYALWRRLHRERKHQFDIGTAAHAAILEPETLDNVMAIIPDRLLGKNGAKSTNACKEWICSQPSEKAVLRSAERDLVLKIRDSVLEDPAHSEAARYLTGGIPEVSCFWHEQFHGHEVDEETGYSRMLSYQHGAEDETTHKLLMKCRPDYIPAELVIVDLKTTANAIDLESFQRQALNLHYHWSAGLTLRGLTQATGKTHRVYVFVVVEINPPFEVAVYQASEDFIFLGIREAMATMERLAWCGKNNVWPGMPNKTLQLGLPAWAHRKLNP